MNQRFHYGLNGLRGVACIIVVLFHCCLAFRFYGLDNKGQLSFAFANHHADVLHFFLALLNGPACVTLFFVLSGLVLALSLSHDGDIRGRAVLPYWIRRLSRLYPLLVMSAILSAILQIMLFRHDQFGALTTWLNDAYRVNLTPKELLRNLVGASGTLNSPAWSIKVEIIASGLFPALYLLSRQRLAAAITLITLVALVFTAHGNGSTIDDMKTYTVSFFVGALIPRWSAPIAHSFTRLPKAARLSMIVMTIAVFCFSQWISRPIALNTLLEMTTSAFLIILIYHRPAGVIAKSAIAKELGEISYSVYLLHMPILLTVLHVWLSVENNPAEIPWASGTIMLAVLTLLVTLPVAHLSYTYFERPFERAGRRLAAKIKSRSGSKELVTTR